MSLQPSCILHQLKGLSHDLTSADASCRCICRMRPVDVLRVLEYASPRPKAVSDDGLRACPLGRVFRPCIMSVAGLSPHPPASVTLSTCPQQPYAQLKSSRRSQ